MCFQNDLIRSNYGAVNTQDDQLHACRSCKMWPLFLILMPALAKALVPRCDGKNPDFTKSPYCLPNDYNMDIVPPTEGPLHINVDIFVFEVL